MELAVAVELNDGSDVAFVEVVVTAATADVHADGDVVTYVGGVVIRTGEIRLTQVSRQRVKIRSYPLTTSVNHNNNR